RKNAGRSGAGGESASIMNHVHLPTVTTRTAAAADADLPIFANGAIAGHTAAATHALREDAVGAVAEGGDRAGVVDDDMTAKTIATAVAADDAFRKNSVGIRAVRDDVAGIGEGDFAAVTAVAAVAADADVE